MEDDKLKWIVKRKTLLAQILHQRKEAKRIRRDADILMQRAANTDSIGDEYCRELSVLDRENAGKK